MRRSFILIGAATLALLPQPVLAQAKAPAATAAPAPTAKPNDRDVFCFIATAFTLSAMKQNEAKLNEPQKKAIPALMQAVPYYAGRVTKRLSGDTLVRALRADEPVFKASNTSVETAGCITSFTQDMQAIIAASQTAGKK